MLLLLGIVEIERVEACSIEIPMCLQANGESGVCPRPTREEILAGRIRLSEQLLRTGEVSVAFDLARMLVPNVVPTISITSSCGRAGDFDRAGHHSDAYFENLVFTRYQPISPYHNALISRIKSGFSGSILRDGLFQACNNEYRQDIAAYLERRFSGYELESLWLFLHPRRKPLTRSVIGRDFTARLTRFDGQSRNPPIVADIRRGFSRDLREFFSSSALLDSILREIENYIISSDTQIGELARICPESNVRMIRETERQWDRLASRIENWRSNNAGEETNQ